MLLEIIFHMAKTVWSMSNMQPCNVLSTGGFVMTPISFWGEYILYPYSLQTSHMHVHKTIVIDCARDRFAGTHSALHLSVSACCRTIALYNSPGAAYDCTKIRKQVYTSSASMVVKKSI